MASLSFRRSRRSLPNYCLLLPSTFCVLVLGRLTPCTCHTSVYLLRVCAGLSYPVYLLHLFSLACLNWVRVFASLACVACLSYPSSTYFFLKCLCSLSCVCLYPVMSTQEEVDFDEEIPQRDPLIKSQEDNEEVKDEPASPDNHPSQLHFHNTIPISITSTLHYPC